jgi:hypothetical protein
MKNRFLGTVAFIGMILGVGSAHAATIGLFNTGVDNSGIPLPNFTPDTHYVLVAGSVDTSPLRVANSSNGFPIGPWLGDDALSAWIGPCCDPALADAAGEYIYRTTFDLTGLDPATAIINGLWSMDDSPVDIFINGNAIGASGSGFGTFAPFSVTSGFVAGLNTLDFAINNLTGPTGLRVEMTGSANAPEPASFLFLSAGLAAFGLIRRRVSSN